MSKEVGCSLDGLGFDEIKQLSYNLKLAKQDGSEIKIWRIVFQLVNFFFLPNLWHFLSQIYIVDLIGYSYCVDLEVTEEKNA